VFSFAAIDWVMTLTPLWFSTVFGVYMFAGSTVAAFALIILLIVVDRGQLWPRIVGVEHLHNLGKFLLAFTCFWAYIAFSQLLLIWIANLPEEVPFYIVRLRTAWRPLGLALILVHFLIPFGALLSRNLKRSRRALGLVAAWMLGAHLADIYWVVMPNLAPQRVVIPWTFFTSFAGVGLAVLATTSFVLRGKSLVPAGDPYLAESIAFRQP
jgi:hypothetical protein